MELLHVADTHLGYRQYRSEERRQDFTDAFSQAIDIAIAEDVDAVIHSGDLFHSKSPTLKTQMECTHQIHRLERQDIPFLGVVGNHERKRDDQWLDLLSLTLDNIHLLDEESWTKGDVTVHGFDYIPSTQWSSADLGVESDSEWDIVSMHLLTHPPVPELFDPHDTEEILDRLGDVDALFLGDYHERHGQRIDDTLVSYPGSTEMVASDEDQNKFVSLIEIDDQIIERDRALDTRDFIDCSIHLTSGSGVDQVSNLLDVHQVEDSVVNMTVSGEDLPISASEIREMIEDRGATVALVDDVRTSEVDLEAVDHDSQDIESAIDEELQSRDLGDVALEIDDIVRDDEIKKSHVRGQTRDTLDENAP